MSHQTGPLHDNNTVEDALFPAGRQSPQTYVRDVAVEGTSGRGDLGPAIRREFNVPIRLTHQPALSPTNRAPISTVVVSSPQEREPFLPRFVDSPDSEKSGGVGPSRPQSGTPKDKLALVKVMPEHLQDGNTSPLVRTGWRDKLHRYTNVKNLLAREGLAEFLGSFILIIFGNGAVAEVVLSKKVGPVNDFFSINIAYGLAVAFGVYVAGGVSGGHLNPAVTLAMACLGRLKWRKVPIYFLAQYLGCFVASAVLYCIYYDALNMHDGGIRITNTSNENVTAGIFASYPQEHVSWQNGLVDQIFATSFLLIGIMALTDERNMAPHKGVVPILVGLLVTAIGLSYGYNCGYPINPARDLGPRIFTAIAGWGVEPFSFRNHNWFWIPVIGPHLGGLLGVAIYQLFIGNQWPVLQRTGIELQVVRRGNANDEYELVKSSHVRSGVDVTVPVSLSTKEAQHLL